MRTQIDLGRRLFGGSDQQRSQASPIRHGTATSASEGGWVSVLLDGSDEPVSIECDGSVEEGQRVSVVYADGTYALLGDGGGSEDTGEYAPLDHEHDAADITTGTLPLTRGGTGAALSATANAIIRYSSNSAKFSSTATANGAFYATASKGAPKFGTLPIAQGGTGATDAATALANIGAAAAEHTHDQYLTEIPSEYITDNELTQKNYITKAALSDYAEESWVLKQIPTKVSAFENDASYATTDWVNNQGYASADHRHSSIVMANDLESATAGFTQNGGTFDFEVTASNANFYVGDISIGGDSVATQSWVNNKGYALAANVAATKYVGTSSGSATYYKIADFGNWGTGNWTQKGFSMLITSRAGEIVWVMLSANDDKTAARAIRLMNTYSKITNVYYSASESAIYVKAATWANNICAHILSNVNGDYVPSVASVSAIASDCVEINIVEFGVNSTSAVVGDSSVLLEMGGSATRPTYNGKELALLSDAGSVDLSGYMPKSGGTFTGTVMQSVAGNPYYGLSDGTTNWYFQAVQSEGKVGLGPTWGVATKWDASGNMLLPGSLDFSNSSAWITPYLLAFKNADPGQAPAYPYTGFYQWGSQWQVNARTSDNVFHHNLLTLDNDLGNMTIKGALKVADGAVGLEAYPNVDGSSTVLNLVGAANARPVYNGMSELAFLSDVSNIDLSGYLPKSGGTLTGPLKVTGGDSANAGKIILEAKTNGQITDMGTSTLFGFTSASDLTVGHSTYNTKLRGKQTRPTYNGAELALLSDAGSVDLSGYATTEWVKSLKHMTEDDVRKMGFLTSLPARLANYQDHTVAVADPNSAVETGFYYINTATNRPPFSQSTNSDYRVLTTAYSDQWLQQIATDFRCADVFIRRRENGTWTDWVKVMTEEGGMFTKPIYFNTDSLGSTGKALEFVCGIDAFAKGGQMGWQSKGEFLAGYATTAQLAGYSPTSHNHDGTYAKTASANTYNGEQKFQNSDYCPTVTDTASGVGCAFKASRGLVNDMLVDALIMTATTGKLPVYSYSGTSAGQMLEVTERASFTSAGGFKLNGGRTQGSGDDEGIVIGKASNNYAGLCLGDPNGLRSVFYLTNTNEAVWRYNNGSANYNIKHPVKEGTIALTSDIPSITYGTTDIIPGSSPLDPGSIYLVYE